MKHCPRFIGNYRQFYRLPEPDQKEIMVAELLGDVTGLYRVRCSEKGIACSIHPGPENLVITGRRCPAKTGTDQPDKKCPGSPGRDH